MLRWPRYACKVCVSWPALASAKPQARPPMSPRREAGQARTVPNWRALSHGKACCGMTLFDPLKAPASAVNPLRALKAMGSGDCPRWCQGHAPWRVGQNVADACNESTHASEARLLPRTGAILIREWNLRLEVTAGGSEPQRAVQEIGAHKAGSVNRMPPPGASGRGHLAQPAAIPPN
jgi:hypothetical protein